MISTSYAIRRLDFRLHDFTRSSWVSDEARATWQPRIQRILACWQEIEWRAVIAGLRPAAISLVASESLPEFTAKMAEYGLAVASLNTVGVSRYAFANLSSEPRPGEPVQHRIAIGSAERVAALQADWDAGREHEVGRHLGYPACCRDFYAQVWLTERFIDTTWPMAVNTAAKTEVSAATYEVGGPPQANILLRWLGVRGVPHLPCSFDCEATVTQADQFVALGRELGYGAEMGWLSDMLNWPAEWSALHGIAEIKTPLLKIITASDATAEPYVVRRHGATYPEAGAQGLRFPYSAPIHLRLTESHGFKRGLAHGERSDLKLQATPAEAPLVADERAAT